MTMGVVLIFTSLASPSLASLAFEQRKRAKASSKGTLAQLKSGGGKQMGPFCLGFARLQCGCNLAKARVKLTSEGSGGEAIPEAKANKNTNAQAKVP